jgi:hypothetical protein
VQDPEYEAALDPGTDTIYASNLNLPQIDVIDAASCHAGDLGGCRPLATIPVQDPHDQVGAIDGANHTLYVADQAGKLVLIDTATCNAHDTAGCATKPATITVGTGGSATALNPSPRIAVHRYRYERQRGRDQRGRVGQAAHLQDHSSAQRKRNQRAALVTPRPTRRTRSEKACCRQTDTTATQRRCPTCNACVAAGSSAMGHSHGCGGDSSCGLHAPLCGAVLRGHRAPAYLDDGRCEVQRWKLLCGGTIRLITGGHDHAFGAT